jgi:hypothetical protein
MRRCQRRVSRRGPDYCSAPPLLASAIVSWRREGRLFARSQAWLHRGGGRLATEPGAGSAAKRGGHAGGGARGRVRWEISSPF